MKVYINKGPMEFLFFEINSYMKFLVVHQP